jgi:hypothetical protein
MGKTHRCPDCHNEVDQAAIVCSNPACRKDLAFCSHCRDIATYELVSQGSGRFGRDKYRCHRCERIGSKCLTWTAGGYCNGLARTGGRWDQPLCSHCNERLGELARTVVGWTLIGAFAGLLKPRR